MFRSLKTSLRAQFVRISYKVGNYAFHMFNEIRQLNSQAYIGTRNEFSKCIEISS